MAVRNLALAAMWLKNIRARTWLIVGVILLTLIGLVVWAGIALLSWLWSMAPGVADEGKRLVGETATKIEAAAPGLAEQAQQLVPGLKEQAEQLVPGLKEQAEQLVPGLKEQAGKLVPGLGSKLPTNDVSGTDIGPVARFPGLLRTQFSRDEKSVSAHFTGRVAFDAVLAHYVKGLTDAGFKHEVISATPDEERHQFKRGKETINFGLLRRPGSLIEVQLQQIST